jgi:hypothetical protein
VLAAQPDNRDAWHLLGLSYHQQFLYEQEQQRAEQQVQKLEDPGMGVRLPYDATLMPTGKKQGQSVVGESSSQSLAEAFVRRAVDLSPTTAFYWSNLGEILRSLADHARNQGQSEQSLEGAYEAAAGAYAGALVADSAYDSAYLNCLRMWTHIGRNDKVVDMSRTQWPHLVQAVQAKQQRGEAVTLTNSALSEMHVRHGTSLTQLVGAAAVRREAGSQLESVYDSMPGVGVAMGVDPATGADRFMQCAQEAASSFDSSDQATAQALSLEHGVAAGDDEQWVSPQRLPQLQHAQLLHNPAVKELQQRSTTALLQLGVLLGHANQHDDAIHTMFRAVHRQQRRDHARYRATVLVNSDVGDAMGASAMKQLASFSQSHPGRGLPHLHRPHPSSGVQVVAIYCNEYGQTWWPGWGPSFINTGLGGSEESAVFISRELARLGYWVEVYAAPNEVDLGHDKGYVPGTMPWAQNAPVWYHYEAYELHHPADIFVAWRYHISMALALPPPLTPPLPAVPDEPSYHSRKYPVATFLWLQDMITAASLAYTRPFVDKINGVFCLSKFHVQILPAYAKPKAVITPNAMTPEQFTDVGEGGMAQSGSAGDRDLEFIYGSAPNRGLLPLLEAWPKILQGLPAHRRAKARLRVYYGFSKAFVKFGQANIPHWEQWRARVEQLLQQPGVVYVGMANHTALSHAYATSGFSLYPTTYPETGCVSLMKAQAMGAIPLTSRYASSTLPELCGKWDLGPRAINGSHENDPTWMDLYASSVVKAVTAPAEQLAQHRAAMVQWARTTFLWSTVARTWSAEFVRGGTNAPPGG